MSNFKFNKISIVESLEADESKTGRKLKEELESQDIFYGQDVSIEFTPIFNKEELISHVNLLAEDARKNGVFPILQIEAHGSNDKQGLFLQSSNSREFISWVELEPVFRNLNIASKCNLLILMATCHGIHSINIISSLDRAPFWGIIGPDDTILPDQILSTTTKFYSELSENRNSSNLLNSLKDSAEKANMMCITSEWYFVKLYECFLKVFSNDQSLNQWVEENGKRKVAEGSPFPPSKRTDMINFALTYREQVTFESKLQYFFMVDIYPENMDKIGVKFEQLSRE